jgi:protease IV
MARALKWLLIISALMLLGGLGLVALTLVSAPSVSPTSILHVRFAGPLRETADPNLLTFLENEETLTLAQVTDSIRRAAKDDRIVGLILDVRAPVLALSDIQAIEAAMTTFRDSEKWNVAFIETAGEFNRGDGPYALATTADKIYLSPPGDIGLTGLRAEVPFVKGTLEKLKVGAYVEKRYEYKNAPNTFTETRMTREHKEALKAVIDDMQEDIAQQIAARRGVPIETVSEWYASGPQMAQEAVGRGLVDGLGYWDEVIAEAERVAGRDDALFEVKQYAETGELHNRGPEVALIYADGEVTRGESTGGDSPTMGSDTVTEAFRAARKEKVKGVLLRINSPGGSYVASDLIRREVEVTRAQGIPVVASMGGLAASGGYFVAMGANSIVAEPSTITGSIGVFSASMATRTFFEHWLGITFDSYDAAPNAGFFQNLDLPNEATKKRVAAFLDRIYDDFVSKAALGRDMSHEEVDKVAHGRIWSGRAAVSLGLVDELGDTEVALTSLKKLMELPADADVTLKVFPKAKSPFAALARALSTSTRVLALVSTLERLATSGDNAATLRLPWLMNIR